MLRTIKKLIPVAIFRQFQPFYHYSMAVLGAGLYRLPGNKIKVIGVTGTKGKSTTTELVSAILEEAGHKTALTGTVRFKIGDKNIPNLYKMSMPGRAFLQKFLRRAVNAGCDYAVIEMTSEGAKMFRHKFIALDALIFTNLSPEHIESHGSYENYRAAKLSLADSLAASSKPNRILVANGDDPEADKFLAKNIPTKLTFSLKQAEPYTLSADGLSFTWHGKTIKTNLVGQFNLYNILAAVTLAEALGIKIETIKSALAKFTGVPGRMEKVLLSNGTNPPFTIIVDYAHTADSMKQLYEAFPGKRKICVFGATGGGRDKWKRPEMGKVADTYCDQIILTNDDPYDEEPQKIVDEISEGIKNKPFEKIIDRRVAMRRAFELAQPGDVVLLSGKGTDPYLMEAGGKKTPWSDARIAREELNRIADRL